MKPGAMNPAGPTMSFMKGYAAGYLRGLAAQADRNPKGQDPQGLGAKHESAVPKGCAHKDQSA